MNYHRVDQFTFNSLPAATSYQDKTRDTRAATRQPVDSALKQLSNSAMKQRPDSATRQRPDSAPRQHPDSATRQRSDSATRQHPDSATRQRSDSATRHQSSSDKYKYRVVVCQNSNSLCSYCHLEIKRQDLMLMTKNQMIQNDSLSFPCYYGFHCDCFFLSANVCNNISEIQGYRLLNSYHLGYLSRKIHNKPKPALLEHPKHQSKIPPTDILKKPPTDVRVALLEHPRPQTKTTPTDLLKYPPSDLQVGYNISGPTESLSYNCERCNLPMLKSDIKIAGTLNSSLRVYHPRCFSEEYKSIPVILAGFNKLNTYDQRGLQSMIKIVKTRHRKDVKPIKSDPTNQLVSKFIVSADPNKSTICYNSNTNAPKEVPNHSQNRSQITSLENRIWESLAASHPKKQPKSLNIDPPNVTVNNRRPTSSDLVTHDVMRPKSSDSFSYNSNPSQKIEDHSQPETPVKPVVRFDNLQRRKPSFKPCVDNIRRSSESLDHRTTNTLSSSPDKTHDSHKIPLIDDIRTDNGPALNIPSHNSTNTGERSFSESTTPASPDHMATTSTTSTTATTTASSAADVVAAAAAAAAQKVELKKSTIRSEITKILYKYNHDYITSKIVRTMLMQRFGCDLTPHKKFIDDTIMELLDIIENNPVNLKSIPGRIFVDEGGIDDISQASPVKCTDVSSDSNALVSPMRAMIDDISPFAIMGNQAEEIEQINVDNSVSGHASDKAWGDKSNSPKVSNGDSGRKESGSSLEEAEESTEEQGQCDKVEETDMDSIPATNSDSDMDIEPATNNDGIVAGSSDKTYALSAADKPINLCECCLCCFRIQSYEEIGSLYNHIKLKHKTSRICAVCNIKFPDVYKLMLHVAEFHRGNKSLKCRKCKKKFGYHDELKKHIDFCFLSDISDNDLDNSPTRSPQNKKQKLDSSTNSATGMAELVSTMKNTQNTLDKINELINSEPSRFE